ncbi:dihydromonapterin reductase [Alginatibacterium sediminis]|uniref:Dihydromonapterin reductase n=1 Tax=Alginatibacterium sediminis TaxID=2164068 RepID=A0A420E9F0_9ALTE|nr:dihydromonapterin reductase [Alginatibacterium sediminis]RKF15948.1 dihydromonapterin reductase [Alginatibacterium sediminis]
MSDSDKPKVLITGAAKRIGLALAQALMPDYQILISYRDPNTNVDALRAQGIQCYQVDFNDDEAIAQFSQTIQSEHETLRAIIHNASSWQSESLEPNKAALIAQMMQVHVSAPYQINFALQSLLNHSDTAGDIIHITDYVAQHGSHKHIAYAASKAALANLSQSFAMQFAPNIKVNSIAPALIRFNPREDQATREKNLNKTLMQIEPGEQEIIKAVEYLLNSSYVTGTTINVDGGRHLV